MPSIHARVADGWRRSRMTRGIRKNAKTYPVMFSARITFFQMPGIAASIATVPVIVEGTPYARYNTPLPPRGGVPKWP